MLKSGLFSRFLAALYIAASVLSFYGIAGGHGLTTFGKTSPRWNPKLTKDCEGSDQFQCDSGQCISLDDKCNGTPQCDDRSDETKETCLYVYCPVYTAKCAYGGCVSANTWCNGVKDCIDNSDEEDCDPLVVPKPTPKSEPTPSNSSGTVTDGCKLPNDLQNGK